MSRVVQSLRIVPQILVDKKNGAKYTKWPNMHYTNIDFSFVAFKHDLIHSYEMGADLRSVCLIAGEEADVLHWIEDEGRDLVTVLSKIDGDILGKELLPQRNIFSSREILLELYDESEIKTILVQEETKYFVRIDEFNIDNYLKDKYTTNIKV